MDLSDKSNEIIFFMDKSREVAEVPGGIQAELEFVDEKRTVRIFLSRTIIGRGNVDIKIDDRKVSEDHAAIGYFDGIFFILDLKSKNGTYVNGQRVVERVLRDGDEVKIGDSPFIFNVSGRIHEEATERWPSNEVSLSKLLGTIADTKGSAKFEDPTRIVIEGSKGHTLKAPLRQLFFEVIDGPDKGKRFNFLQKEILIGRGRGDLVLSDPDISKRHAEVIIYGADQIFIRDLGSTNGTFIEEEKVDRRQIKKGDQITLGSTKLEITFGEVVTAPARTPDPSDEKTTEKRMRENFLVLAVIDGRDKGEIFQFEEGEFIIGREQKEKGKSVSLKDMDVSRKHAKLTIGNGGKTVLSDLGSTNGTILNGKKIKKVELKVGDEIVVGNTKIKIEKMPALK